jgi:hypothetical protein
LLLRQDFQGFQPAVLPGKCFENVKKGASGARFLPQPFGRDTQVVGG